MATALEADPLYQEQYKAGQELLGLYDPAAEEERRKKAWDQASTAIAKRMSGMGYTGSSTDLDTLERAAKDFNLSWAERKPAQLSAAITGSQVPIGNLLQSISQEATLGGTYEGEPSLQAKGLDIQRAQADAATELAKENQKRLDLQLAGQVAASLGLPQYLSELLFGKSGTGSLGTGSGGGGLVGTAATGLIPKFINWATQNGVSLTATNLSWLSGGAGEAPAGWSQFVASQGGNVSPEVASWLATNPFGPAPEMMDVDPAALLSYFTDASAPAAGAEAGAAAAEPLANVGPTEAQLIAEWGLTPAEASAIAPLLTEAGPTAANIAAEFSPTGTYAGLGSDIVAGTSSGLGEVLAAAGPILAALGAGFSIFQDVGQRTTIASSQDVQVGLVRQGLAQYGSIPGALQAVKNAKPNMSSWMDTPFDASNAPGGSAYNAARTYLILRSDQRAGFIQPDGSISRGGDLNAPKVDIAGPGGFDQNRATAWINYLRSVDHEPTWDKLMAFSKSIEPAPVDTGYFDTGR